MRFAVVGANGFLGGAAAHALAAAGHDVTPVLRGEALPATSFDAVVDCNGDARRYWAAENPNRSLQANVVSVAARLVGLRYRRYVFVSTIDVYGPAVSDPRLNGEDAPLDPAAMVTYGFHKYLAELAVRHHAGAFVILRLGTLIGPGLRKNPVFDALTGAPVRLTPDSTLSLIDLDHAARSIVRLLEGDAAGIFNVTGSAPVAVRDMAERVAASGRAAADIRWHADLQEMRYDIAIGRISAYMALPGSAVMLDRFLESTC